MKTIASPKHFTVASIASLALAFCASVAPGTLNAEIPAKGVGHYSDEKSKLTLVVGEVKISTGWEFAALPANAPVNQLFWLPEKFDFSENESPDIGKASTSPATPDITPAESAPPPAAGTSAVAAKSIPSGSVAPAALISTGHISAANANVSSPAAPAVKTKTRRFAALLRDKNATEAVLTLRNVLPESGTARVQTETLRWNLADARKNAIENNEIFRDWTQTRAQTWNALTDHSSPNLLADFWNETHENFYGATFSRDGTSRRNRRVRSDRADALSTFSVLGGQMAIRETFQTDLLNGAFSAAPPVAETTVDIASIKGVEVKPHPYAKMLAALKLPTAPASSLADYVPVDRLFVLLREPKQISALLSGADDTVSRLSPFLGESFADHAILARHTAKFGLTPEQARQWFSGGNVAEAALFAPDIFFRDNTDITLILRLKPGAATPFKFVASLSGARLEIPLANGESFHLASRDSLLFLSSRKTEIEKALALADAKGVGSLGQLDEFRVMTAKLPVAPANAGAYVYFSDPFIRRITGPEVKIGQLRRATARAKIELFTVSALTYRLDFGTDAPDVEALFKWTAKDKMPSAFEAAAFADLSLRPGCVVASKSWGTLANLRPLSAAPVVRATAKEAEAYAAYRESYSNYWREYFDPIAVRLDICANGKTSLETFILPLVDNSLYNELRSTFAKSAPDATALPCYREPPVATLAFQFPAAGRAQGATRMLGAPFVAKLGRILPYLKETVTLAVRDAAPVVQATFPGLNTLDQRGGLSGVRGSDLLFVPFVAALVTRPCDIAIPVTDEAAVREALRGIPSDAAGHWWIQECVFVEAENRLLLTFTFENVIRLEFSVSVENGWLHISNHPWTPVPIVGSSVVTPNHANVSLAPTNLREGLPQALAQAASAWRKSLYSTTAELLPWMEAYGVDAAGALRLQRAALGRATPLPAGAILDRSVSPARLVPFGTWAFAKVPEIRLPDTGLFRGGLGLSLWMRFEDDGLRSRVEIINELR